MKYQDGYRRLLLDMHIPDWDPGFLAGYDPKQLADQYERANLTSVMLYCKSHVGRCYWPTKIGKMHEGLGGRDSVGELLGELSRRGIGTCAYTSVVFDNWAVETHPDWRQVRTDGFDGQDYLRYGWCCQNNPDYLAYERDLTTELLTSYQFDALFIDMPFWPLPCACDNCRTRLKNEDGIEMPTTVDWTTAEWCTFQAARERWSDGLIAGFTALARETSPGIAVTHNMAPALANYVLGQPLAAARHDDFVAGDLYGDRYEQLAVSKLSTHLTETRPAEFMTSRCVNLTDHVRLKREAEMEMQAFAATAMSSAFLFIDAIDPAGTVNPGVYERIGRIFERTAPYEPFLGGEPLEDVAVYWSVDSQMDFADNGTPITGLGGPSNSYPHGNAVQGTCRALQRAHIPFGVITRKQLAAGELARWPVVVLPNVLRMDAEERDAFRHYVSNGGRLYASRWTSLVDTAGTRLEDFGLADVFGCHAAGEEQGRMVYLRPSETEAGAEAGFGVASAIAPQEHVSLTKGMIRLAPVVDRSARAVALLTLPYGHPAPGSVKDHQWASIHSSPPWEDTPHPVVVANDFGAGRSIYCAADIETTDAEAHERLFVHLLNSLLPSQPSFAIDSHPAVWANAFDQAENQRVVATFLNYQAELPPVPVPVAFRLRPPLGMAFTGLTRAPDGESLPYDIAGDGTLSAHLDQVDVLGMIVASYTGDGAATAKS